MRLLIAICFFYIFQGMAFANFQDNKKLIDDNVILLSKECLRLNFEKNELWLMAILKNMGISQEAWDHFSIEAKNAICHLIVETLRDHLIDDTDDHTKWNSALIQSGFLSVFSIGLLSVYALWVKPGNKIDRLLYYALFLSGAIVVGMGTLKIFLENTMSEEV